MKQLKRKTAQEIQDEIFRKMPFPKKIHLGSDLTMLGLKLKRLNKNAKRPKTNFENIILSRLLCNKREKQNNHSKEIKNDFKIYRGILNTKILKKQAAKMEIAGLLKKFLK